MLPHDVGRRDRSAGDLEGRPSRPQRLESLGRRGEEARETGRARRSRPASPDALGALEWNVPMLAVVLTIRCDQPSSPSRRDQVLEAIGLDEHVDIDGRRADPADRGAPAPGP